MRHKTSAWRLLWYLIMVPRSLPTAPRRFITEHVGVYHINHRTDRSSVHRTGGNTKYVKRVFHPWC
jgi:hypothetical protein